MTEQSLPMRQRQGADLRQIWQQQLNSAPYVLVFDGECVLCSNFFRFVVKHDRAQQVRFVLAQSELGRQLYQALGLPCDSFETNLVLRHGQVFTKADGFAVLLDGFGGAWRLAQVIRLLPHWLKNPLYSLIARNRYRLFGRYDRCMLPNPALRHRFLDRGLG